MNNNKQSKTTTHNFNNIIQITTNPVLQGG